MEALVFGLIALIALKKKQERIVSEPAEFQPFDLRGLGRLYDARESSASGTFDRKRSYVAQTVS
jgi:hypothetical protein